LDSVWGEGHAIYLHRNIRRGAAVVLISASWYASRARKRELRPRGITSQWSVSTRSPVGTGLRSELHARFLAEWSI